MISHSCEYCNLWTVAVAFLHCDSPVVKGVFMKKPILLFVVAVLLSFVVVSCKQDIEVKTYTVTFDANDADSGTVPTAIQVQEGKSFTVPSQGTLLKNGYDFVGWNTKADGSGELFAVSQSVNATKDMKLFAIWKEHLEGPGNPNEPDRPNNPDLVYGSLIFSYSSQSDSYSVSGYQNKAATAIVIPAEYEGKPVTRISNIAFRNCVNLTMVTIPDSVTSIGWAAFSGCTGINSIVIPESVIEIGQSAFYGCRNLTSVAIPSSVVKIGIYAFERCFGLESIEVDSGNSVYYSEENCIIEKETRSVILGCKNSLIPDGVVSIGDDAFYQCKELNKLIIPDGVVSIGDNAFEYCEGLVEVHIPSSVTNIGKAAFVGCKNLEIIEIDDENTVYYTKDNCIFERESNRLLFGLSACLIPDGATSVGSRAFWFRKDLKRISIPASVTNIASDAFAGCSNLEFIEVDSENPVYYSEGNCLIEKETKKLVLGCKKSMIPKGVTSIGDYAFECCSGLTEIVIPSSVTSIGVNAFENCSELTEIGIPSSVTSIESGAFSSCSSLTEIMIPSSVTEMGVGLFMDCDSLKTVEFEKGTQIIHGDVFTYIGEHVVTVVIPSTVITMDRFDFISAYEEKVSIVFAEGLKSIPKKALYQGRLVVSVTIPSSVMIIGDYAFASCRNLAEINYSGTCSQWNSISKGSNWSSSSDDYIINCTDGNIAKN